MEWTPAPPGTKAVRAISRPTFAWPKDPEVERLYNKVQQDLGTLKNAIEAFRGRGGVDDLAIDRLLQSLGYVADDIEFAVRGTTKGKHA